VIFALKENFDGSGIRLTSTPQSDTVLQRISDSNAFENQSAIAYLDAQHLIFECASTDSLSLPADGSPVYMELNYKTNTEFTVGLYAITSFQIYPLTVLNIRATSEWKKMYINLSDATTTVPNALGFKPFIQWKEAAAWVMLNFILTMLK
jgi:hypothetical protein